MPIYEHNQILDWDGNYLGEQEEEVFLSMLGESGGGSGLCPINNVCDYEPPECDPSYLEEGHELILQIVEDRDDGNFTCPTGQYSQNQEGNGLTFGRSYIADASIYIYNALWLTFGPADIPQGARINSAKIILTSFADTGFGHRGA